MIALLRRELVVVVAVAALVVFATLAGFYTRSALAPGSRDLYGHDFQSFYAAARLADAGAPGAAYDRARHHAEQRAVVAATTGGDDSAYYYFGYPPTYLALLLPLASFGYLTAFALFMTIGAALLATALARIGGWRAVVVGFAAPVTALTFLYGQNAWATAGLAGLALVWLPRRQILAGLALGVLTAKPQLGLAYPFALLAAGYFRATAVAAGAAIALIALAYDVLGWGAFEAFLDSIAGSRAVLMDQSQVGIGRLQSVFALVRLAGGAVEAAYAAQAIVAVAVAVILVWVWRGAAPYAAKAALTLASSLAMSPFVLPYDMTTLVPAAAFLLAGGGARPAVQAALFGAAVLMLPAIVLWPDIGVLFGLPALALVYAAALASSVMAPETIAGAVDRPDATVDCRSGPSAG